MKAFQKYKPFPPVILENRQWPARVIDSAPIWCSVDLRDGNQALPIPMNVSEKLEMFHLLLELGFKQIEVGFPSASDTEYAFLRKIIDEKLIPDDVTIQVLTQSRKELIEKTFESLQGAKKAIIHLYNSTSTLQRKVVFGKEQKEIIKIAVNGASLIQDFMAQNKGLEIIHEYSPESFTGTELDFALEICHEVMDVWQPTPQKKLILNLPSTVEMAMPNVYADQIEWFGQNVKKRDSVLISLHAHNDRGTSVAASEMALLAGADRVEGTLFGNGERTGNADILTIGMNLFSQGINPQLDFSNMQKIVDIYQRCTRMPVHPRHPYAGDLVYTAFSGSHQDAIRKGFEFNRNEKAEYWEVPYLPIDPADVGREYEAIIRINSQSGKGGVAFIMEQEFGYKLPKNMHPEFGDIIKKATDRVGKELSPSEIFQIFKEEYLEQKTHFQLLNYKIEEKAEQVSLYAEIELENKKQSFEAKGNGPIDAFFTGLKSLGISGFKFISYDEHSLNEGSDSKAVAYIQLENNAGERIYGVGLASNINTASIYALLCAINRGITRKS